MKGSGALLLLALALLCICGECPEWGMGGLESGVNPSQEPHCPFNPRTPAQVSLWTTLGSRSVQPYPTPESQGKLAAGEEWVHLGAGGHTWGVSHSPEAEPSPASLSSP